MVKAAQGVAGRPARLAWPNELRQTLGMADKEFLEPGFEPLEEREALTRWLDYHRGVLVWKLNGVTDEDLRRPMVPTGTSLLGLVKHLAYVERWWFQEVFAGQAFGYPDGYDPESQFRPDARESPTDLIAFYRDMSQKSRVITAAAASLDEVARRDRPKPTLRWILDHMIEETARHNGHADILRELIDGSVGD